MNRRSFLTHLSGAAVASGLLPSGCATARSGPPSFLRDHADLYARDPRAAGLLPTDSLNRDHP